MKINKYSLWLMNGFMIAALCGQMACGLTDKKVACADFNKDSATCNKSKDAKGVQCVYDTALLLCEQQKNSNNPHNNNPNRSVRCAAMTRISCDAHSDCKYLVPKNPVLSGTCYESSELGKACPDITDILKCETPGYAKDSCVYWDNKCHVSLGYDARGFDRVTKQYKDGGIYDAQFFDADGLYLGVNVRDNRGFDVDGLDIDGFDRLGLHPITGTIYDNYGFDRNGRVGVRNARGFVGNYHQNGTTRDDRGFDVNGLLEDGSSRDFYGFDADNCNARGFHRVRRLQLNGNDRDPQGFNINGVHTNGTTRDGRGFDATGRLFGGALTDARGFDYRGILANGDDTDDRGFNALGQHDNGTNSDDYGFNVNGQHTNGTMLDDHGFYVNGTHLLTGNTTNPAGFDIDGYHTNLSPYDDQGFDIDGLTSRGFNRGGLLADGRDRDDRGFDAAGLLATGHDRDARGFDADGVHTNGTIRDDRGFDIAGLLINNSDRDDRGFDVAGLLANNLDRDARGFDANEQLPNGDVRDARGFNARGMHQNNTRYDALGYNVDGRNQRGFNALGMHANGTNRDDRGFDSAGALGGGGLVDARGFDAHGDFNGSRFDNLGFDVVGNHRNGTLYDAQGYRFDGRYRDSATNYDAAGFDRNGNHRTTLGQYDPQGFNRLGFDANGFNDEGLTKFGHEIQLVVRDAGGANCHSVTDRHANVSFAGPGCFNQADRDAWFHNAEGIDPEGYFPKLSRAAVGKDEAFDAQGYNRAGLNFLGISRARFAADGYDAIVIDDLGGFNQGAGTPWNQLVQDFETTCFPIGKIEAGLPHYDGTTDEYIDVSSRINFRDWMQNYWMINESEAYWEGHLKKGVYFCRWLYGSGMEKGKTFSELSPLTKRIEHRAGSIDYVKELQFARFGDNVDYLTRLETAMLEDALLNSISYEDPRDTRDLNGKKADMRNFIGKVRTAQGAGNNSVAYVADIKKASYQLYKLSQVLPARAALDRGLAAPKFLHGARHCPDAMRQAIDESYKYYCADDHERLVNAGLSFSDQGLAERINRMLSVQRHERFTVWLKAEVQLSGGDLASGFSSAYKTFAKRLGLTPMQNAHDLNYAVTWGNHVEPDFLLNNAAANKNYSPFQFHDLAVKSLENDTLGIKELLRGIFGYLDSNPYEDKVGTGIMRSHRGGIGDKEHMLITDLLRRLDFLKNR